MAAKKTGDPIEDLPQTSRKYLEAAPADGRYLIPYTVGRVFHLRGWGAHQGKNSTRASLGAPTTLFQLNQEGLKAADLARAHSRAKHDETVYKAVHESTAREISRLLEDSTVEQLIGEAKALIVRVEEAGNSTAGARGYLDALVEYRDEQAAATA